MPEFEPITIIDSGIYNSHKYFKKFRFKYIDNNTINLKRENIKKGRENEIFYFKGKYGDFIDDYRGHGTAITYIITKYTRNVLFYDISFGKFRNVYRFDNNELFHILKQSYSLGSRIVVMSFGSKIKNITNENRIDDFLFKHPDLNVFAAAGNKPGYSTINSPGHCFNIITVGAGVHINNSSSIAGFSANGPSNFDNIKPDLLDQSIIFSPSSYKSSSSGEYRKGSSLANAVVAGKAFKIIQDIKEKYSIKYIPSSLVKAILIYTSKPVNSVAYIRENKSLEEDKNKYSMKKIEKDISIYQQGNGYNMYENMNNICFILPQIDKYGLYEKIIPRRGTNKVVAVYIRNPQIEQIEDYFFDIKINDKDAGPLYKYNVKSWSLHNIDKDINISIKTNMNYVNNQNIIKDVAVVYSCDDHIRKKGHDDRYNINFVFLNVLILLIVFKVFLKILYVKFKKKL
jgi:hypothetical protein